MSENKQTTSTAPTAEASPDSHNQDSPGSHNHGSDISGSGSIIEHRQSSEEHLGEGDKTGSPRTGSSLPETTLSVRARYKELKQLRRTAPPASPTAAVDDQQKILAAKDALTVQVQTLKMGVRYGPSEENMQALRAVVQVENPPAAPKRRKSRLNLSGIFSTNTGTGRTRAATLSASTSGDSSPERKLLTEETFKKEISLHRRSPSGSGETLTIGATKGRSNSDREPRKDKDKEKDKDRFGSLKGGFSPRGWMENRRVRFGTLTGVSNELLDKLAVDKTLESLENRLEGKESPKMELRLESKGEIRASPSGLKKKYHIFGVSLNAELLEEEMIPPFLQLAVQTLLSDPKAISPLTFDSEVNADDVEFALEKLEEEKSTLEATLHSLPAAVIGHLLIRYFDSLTEPVFTHRLVWDWYFAADVKDPDYRIQCLRLLFYSLPSLNRAVIEFVVVFLKKFKDIARVANVFGSVMLKVPEGENVRPTKSIITPFLPPPLAQAHLPQWLLQHFVHDLDDILSMEGSDFKFSTSSGSLQIAEATPLKLLQLVTNPFYHELEFRETFLLTHMYYVNTIDLPHMLFSTFQQSPTEPWHKVVRLRTVQLIKEWFGRHLNELVSNRQFTTTMRKLVEEHGLKCSDEEAAYFLYITSILQNVERHKPSTTRNISFYFNEKIKNEKNPDLNFNILGKEYNPLVIAQQLTLIDHDMMRAILTTEFLKKAFTNAEQCPNFMAMADKFNTWSLWIPTEILKRQTAQERAEVIHQFIRIARQCRRLRNFNTCYAIVAGLGNSSVSRLKLTWAKVARKAKVKLNALLELFEMSYNFKNYREALRASSPPIIPYLGIFPKDLTSIEENNPNTVGNGHVNFVKMRLLYAVVSQIYKSQHVQYGFEREPKLRRYLKNMTILTEAEAHSQSLIAEPRTPS